MDIIIFEFMEGFIMKKINIAEQSFNPFELIGKDWMLISAGTAEKETITESEPDLTEVPHA